jgi:hypothetical protein
MRKNFVVLILFLIVFISPQTVFGDTPTAGTTSKESSVDMKIENSVTSFFPRLKQFFIDHTPAFIKDNVLQAVKVTEEFRIDLKEKLESKQTQVQAEISALEIKKSTPTEHMSWKERAAPIFRKIELFFTNTSITIFSSQILFYGFALLLLITIIHIISKRLF